RERTGRDDTRAAHDGALGRGVGKEVSSHDVGRMAELGVLQTQLGDKDLSGTQRRELGHEQRALLDSLGLLSDDNVAVDKRLKALDKAAADGFVDAALVEKIRAIRQERDLELDTKARSVQAKLASSDKKERREAIKLLREGGAEHPDLRRGLIDRLGGQTEVDMALLGRLTKRDAYEASRQLTDDPTAGFEATIKNILDDKGFKKDTNEFAKDAQDRARIAAETGQAQSATYKPTNDDDDGSSIAAMKTKKGKQEEIVDFLRELPHDQRQELRQRMAESGLLDALSYSMTQKRSDVAHQRFDALMDPNQQGGKARLLGIDMAQALKGEEVSALPGKSKTDRLQAGIDQLRANPALLEQAAAQFTRSSGREGDDSVGQMIDMVSQSMGEKAKGDDSTKHLRGEAAHKQLELVQTLADPQHIDVTNKLKKFCGGELPNANTIRAIGDFVNIPGEAGESFKQRVKEVLGVEPDQLRDYVETVHENDVQVRARQIAGADGKKERLAALQDDRYAQYAAFEAIRAQHPDLEPPEGIKQIKRERDQLEQELREVMGDDGFRRLTQNSEGQFSTWRANYDDLNRQTWKKGVLPPEYMVYAGVRGVGSDMAMVQQALKGKSPEQIDQLCASFAATFDHQSFKNVNGDVDIKYDHDVAAWDKKQADRDFMMGAIASDFSGRDLHRLKIDMMGDPTAVFDPTTGAGNPEGRLDLEQKRLQEDFDFESKNEWSKATKEASSQVGEAKTALDKFFEGDRADLLRKGDEATWQEFLGCRQSYEELVEVNIGARDALAKKVGTGLALTGAAAAITFAAVGSGGWAVPLLIGGGTGLVKYLAADAIQGRGRTDEEKIRQLAVLIVDQGINVGSSGLEDIVAKLAVSGGKNALTTAGGGLSEAAEERAIKENLTKIAAETLLRGSGGVFAEGVKVLESVSDPLKELAVGTTTDKTVDNIPGFNIDEGESPVLSQAKVGTLLNALHPDADTGGGEPDSGPRSEEDGVWLDVDLSDLETDRPTPPPDNDPSKRDLEPEQDIDVPIDLDWDDEVDIERQVHQNNIDRQEVRLEGIDEAIAHMNGRLSEVQRELEAASEAGNTKDERAAQERIENLQSRIREQREEKTTRESLLTKAQAALTGQTEPASPQKDVEQPSKDRVSDAVEVQSDDSPAPNTSPAVPAAAEESAKSPNDIEAEATESAVAVVVNGEEAAKELTDRAEDISASIDEASTAESEADAHVAASEESTDLLFTRSTEEANKIAHDADVWADEIASDAREFVEEASRLAEAFVAGIDDGAAPLPGPDAMSHQQLMDMQREQKGEMLLSTGPNGHATSGGSSGNVGAPDDHVGYAHTHPDAVTDPRMLFPSGG
ncbi:MAG: hypothetical protein HN348_14780, partial [Proteobacteria bacterium]|nr:hypothetical protein [Pseudomonadota bacterium]